MKKLLTLTLAALLLTGCATLFKTTLTLTHVVDSAMKSWAQLSVTGQTTADLDARVIAAHDRYRASCAVARDALIAYKAGGSESQWLAALEATRTAVDGIIAIVAPLFPPDRAAALKTATLKAKTI